MKIAVSAALLHQLNQLSNSRNITRTKTLKLTYPRRSLSVANPRLTRPPRSLEPSVIRVHGSANYGTVIIMSERNPVFTRYEHTS